MPISLPQSATITPSLPPPHPSPSPFPIPLPTHVHTPTQELALFEWFAEHSGIEAPRNPPELLSALNNGVALCRLLLAFVPQLAAHLRCMYTEPADDDQRRHNAVLISQAMQQLQLTFSLDCDDILTPCPAYAVLLLRYLRYVLPQLAAPPAVVTLQGRLGQLLRATHPLASPFSQTCLFRVVRFGADEFEMEERIKVLPRSTAPLAISLAARRQQGCQATVFCVGRVQDSAHELFLPVVVKAEVLARPASTHLTLTTRCYEQCTEMLTVRNACAAEAVLEVHLLELTEDRLSERETEGAYPSFWSRTERLTVAANATGSIPISFLPTRLGTHQLAVLVTDTERGTQQCLGVVGLSEQPEPLGVFKSYNDLRNPRLQPIRVPHVNEARREALSVLSRATSGLSNLQRFSPPSARLKTGPVQLAVRVQGCPHVTAPASVEIVPATRDGDPESNGNPRGRSGSSSGNSSGDIVRRRGGGEVPLTFQPLAAGTYSFDLTLTGPEDTRVYRLEADVVEALTTRLQAKVEPGETHVFKAVVSNVCRSTHTYGVELTGHPAFATGAHRTFEVSAGKDATLHVSFTSQDVGAYHATLIVTDVRADSNSRFSLHATVERARASSRGRSSRRAHSGGSPASPPVTAAAAAVAVSPVLGRPSYIPPGAATDSVPATLRVPPKSNGYSSGESATTTATAGHEVRSGSGIGMGSAADGDSTAAQAQNSTVRREGESDAAAFEDVLYVPASGEHRLGFRLSSQAAVSKAARAWVEPADFLTVTPKTATLPPAGSKGQLFVLSVVGSSDAIMARRSEASAEADARLFVEVRTQERAGQGWDGVKGKI